MAVFLAYLAEAAIVYTAEKAGEYIVEKIKENM